MPTDALNNHLKETISERLEDERKPVSRVGTERTTSTSITGKRLRSRKADYTSLTFSIYSSTSMISHSNYRDLV